LTENFKFQKSVPGVPVGVQTEAAGKPPGKAIFRPDSYDGLVQSEEVLIPGVQRTEMMGKNKIQISLGRIFYGLPDHDPAGLKSGFRIDYRWFIILDQFQQIILRR
jgi:hypothetical protein